MSDDLQEAAPPRATMPSIPAAVRRRRRRRWPWLLGVLAVVGLWCAGAGVSVLQARSQLLTARSSIAAGKTALLEGDVSAAHDEFSRSRVAFLAAERRLSNPFVRSFEVFAPLYDDIATARALASAGALVAEAADGVAGTVANFPDGLASLQPQDGALPVERIAALAEPLAEAESLLVQARDRVESAPAVDLAVQVADARAEFDSQLTEAQGLVEPAAALTAVLPDFLGANEPRRYFFGAQNPAELRATGGFMGAYTIVEVDDGRLSFGSFEELNALPDLSADAVEPPYPGFGERYNRYGGAGRWEVLNATPDFPAAAVATERLWQAVFGEQLDGVIAVDPAAFRALLEVTGPVQVPEIGTVTAETVVEVVANDAYAAFDDEAERKEVLGAVAASALQSFLGGSNADIASVRKIAEAAGQRHILLHSARAQEQAVFEEVGVAGGFPAPEGDFLSVIVNAGGANKVDFYTDRTVRYSAQLLPGGAVDADVQVRLRNSAPTEGLPKRVIGPNFGDLEAGENLSILSVYCGAGCVLTGYDRTLGDQQLLTEQELGHTVYTTFVELPSGQEAVLDLGWAGGGRWDAETGVYRFRFWNQPTIRPTDFTFEARLPEGWVVAEASEGVEVTDGSVTWSGQATAETVVELRLARTPPEAETAEPEGLVDRLRRFLRTPFFRLPERSPSA